MYAIVQCSASQNLHLADVGSCGTSLPQGDDAGIAQGIPLVLRTVGWTLVYNATLHLSCNTLIETLKLSSLSIAEPQLTVCEVNFLQLFTLL